MAKMMMLVMMMTMNDDDIRRWLQRLVLLPTLNALPEQKKEFSRLLMVMMNK